MVSQQEVVFNIRQRRIYLTWFLAALLLGSIVVIPALIASQGQRYPDLELLLVFSAVSAAMWIAVLVDYSSIATRIELNAHDFVVKKIGIGRRASRHSYASIIAYNERPNSSKVESFNELTVYLTDNWFMIRSNEFADYDYLKDQFAQYGHPTPRQRVLTLPERNRLRWSLGVLALLLVANIIYAYVAHNATDKQPARLIEVTGIINQIAKDTYRGNLKGFKVQLRNWPEFEFYVSRRNYDADIRSFQMAVSSSRSLTLLIRESDYRKKLRKTKPLTFGDRFDLYNEIMVFGAEQNPWLHIRTTHTVYEPTHTNPALRTLIFSFFLLFCWAGWVYFDSYKILPANELAFVNGR